MIEFRLIDDVAACRAAMSDARDLFGRVYPQRAFPEDIWRCWYFENPEGPPLVALGYAEGKLVAHQAFIPQRLGNAAGESLPYMFSISSMVDPACRSWTTFRQIMSMLHDGAAQRGFELVLVMPNAQASQLYRMLYHYETLFETPLCTWHASSEPARTPSGLRDVTPPPTAEWWCPTDEEYWSWRTSVNHARCLELTAETIVIVKLSPDGALTILDVVGPAVMSPAPISQMARLFGTSEVRVTALHAEALGIPAAELVPHNNYIARLACRSSLPEMPKIRFSLLLSDAF